MQYFLFGIVALALALAVLQRTSGVITVAPARVVSTVACVALLATGLVALVRGWTGAAVAAAGVAACLLLYLAQPWLLSRGRLSRLTTEYLDIEIDPDSGTIRGRVLKGFFAGRSLRSLRAVELAHLWADCQFADPRSAGILAGHLDRMHPTWRDDMARTSDAQGQREAPDGKLHMTREEALDILGLESGATVDDVRAAHRNLMLKLHPDRGGSHYLAAKVNEAKSALLD